MHLYVRVAPSADSTWNVPVSRVRIRIDRIACDGRGLCAEILPELISLDDWGFPIVSEAVVPEEIVDVAEDAVEVCPKLALWLEAVTTEGQEKGADGKRGAYL